jgi:peptide chain release factor 2
VHINHESVEENTSAFAHQDQCFRLLFVQLGHQVNELRAMMALASQDSDLLLEWSVNLKRLERMLFCLDRMIQTLDRFDSRGAYIQLVATHPSAEAFLWVERLNRMLINWAKKLEFQSKVFHQHPATQGGIEEITLRMEGPFAFGLLRPEMGLHCWGTANQSDASSDQRTRSVQVTVSPIITATELAIENSELYCEVFSNSEKSRHS